jgi:hypothetical protein
VVNLNFGSVDVYSGTPG